MKVILPIALAVYYCIFTQIFVDGKFFSVAIARDRLLSDLFVNYNPSSRPAPRGERIEVDVNIELQHFDFRESDGAFNIVGLLNAAWCDKKLSWNPKDYNNVTEIAINQKLVWVPDLEMYNNAPDKFLRMHRNGVIVLNYMGNMTWSDAIELTIFCSTNMLHWPRDKHICHLVLGSWVYDGNDVDITNNPNTSLSFDNEHIQNMDYEITNYRAEHVTTKYDCCTEPYVSISYVIEFKRRAGFSTILYIPAYTIIIFTLLALAMNVNRSEKIILTGINLILIVFQLLYFSQSVGKFARGTPYIVVFYSCSLVVVTFAHLICVFSLWTSRSIHKGKQLPSYLTKFLKGSIAQYISSNKFFSVKRENTDSQFEDVKLSDCSTLIPVQSSNTEWICLATLLERVALVGFSIVYLLLATICLA